MTPKGIYADEIRFLTRDKAGRHDVISDEDSTALDKRMKWPLENPPR
jgi:hypothetical protein